MRVTVSTPSTGFVYAPGLAKAVTIEVADLPKDEAQEIETLVNGCNFFQQPALMAPSTGTARDVRSMRITIEDKDRTHTIEVSEPFSDIQDEQLRVLVEVLSAQRKRILMDEK